MSKKNPDSKLRYEAGKRPVQLRKALRGFFFSTLAFVVALPVPVLAQAPAAAPQVNAQAPVYGGGIQTPLLFEGEVVPTNEVSLSAGVTSLFDDNVFARNDFRVSDEAAAFDSELLFRRQTDRFMADLDYRPFYVLYRKATQYDHTNQAATLNLGYRLARNVTIAMYGNGGYQNGDYPTINEQPIMSGPPSPTDINHIVGTYTTRVLSGNSGLDLTISKGRRISLTFTGNYNETKFGQQLVSEPLYNSDGLSGGMTFEYRLTAHTNFGILLLHQDSTYSGNGVFGTRLRSQVESSFLSLGSRLSPSLGVTVFAGLQYVRARGQFTETTGAPGNLQVSGGGSITRQVRNTAIDATFQRSVSDGAGLYTAAINTTVTVGLRRRLVGLWEGSLSGGLQRVDASLFKLANARTEAATAGVNISRPLSRRAYFHISYNSAHQLSHGTLPVFVNFDRNQVSAGIDYQIKARSIGR